MESDLMINLILFLEHRENKNETEYLLNARHIYWPKYPLMPKAPTIVQHKKGHQLTEKEITFCLLMERNKRKHGQAIQDNNMNIIYISLLSGCV